MSRPAKWHADGRVHNQTFTARTKVVDGKITLLSPTVGWWRDRPAPGSLVTPGSSLGQLEILGVLYGLVAPKDAAGVVLEAPGTERMARTAVDARSVLLTVDPEATAASAGLAAQADTTDVSETGLVFRAPLSGRYYARPAPGEDAFVQVGDVIAEGQTVALLEVMKTFNRITYGGGGLPAQAKVVAIGPGDEDDIEEDDVLLQLEPV